MPRGVRFVETMVGTVAGEPFGLHDLVLEVQPVPGPDDGLPGVVRGGTVRWGGRRYPVTGGRFVALAADRDGGRCLRYELTAAGWLAVTGVKRVTGRPWRWWRDTTRMDVTVGPAATGTVRLGVAAFLRQLTTFRGRPVDIAAFALRFLARLVRAGARPHPADGRPRGRGRPAPGSRASSAPPPARGRPRRDRPGAAPRG
jgi:hypothetical protein